jgi:uncharacterized membrane protein YgcG
MVLTRADAASKLGTVTISATTSEELDSLLSGSHRHSSVLLPPGAVVERRSPPTAESQLFTVTLRRQPPSYWRGQARPGDETLGFTPTVLQLQVLYPYYIEHRQGSGISMEVLREHLIRDGSLKTTPWLIPTLEELDAWWTSENDRRSRPVVAIGSFVRVTPGCGGRGGGGSGGSKGSCGGSGGGGGGVTVLGKVTKRKRGIWTVETEDGHEHKRRLAQLVLDEKDTMFGQATHAGRAKAHCS